MHGYIRIPLCRRRNFHISFYVNAVRAGTRALTLVAEYVIEHNDFLGILKLFSDEQIEKRTYENRKSESHLNSVVRSWAIVMKFRTRNNFVNITGSLLFLNKSRHYLRKFIFDAFDNDIIAEPISNYRNDNGRHKSNDKTL